MHKWLVIYLLPLAVDCTFKTPVTVTFNNGVKVPILGLGTFRSQPNEVAQSVKDAIDAGYRHIDCAHIYQNEKEVGEAIAQKIKEKVVKREELFVTGKLWNAFHRADQVEKGLQITLKDLGLEYIDLFLVHWPMGYEETEDYVDTWLEMEKIYKSGLARSIGISNFNKKQIARLLERATVIPVTNQVECHPYLNQRKLLEFCKSKNITLTAHTPLGSSRGIPDKPNIPLLLENPQIKSVALKYHKTPAQILIRYQIQRGVIVIPKSVHKSRILENYRVFDFAISDGDMKIIDGLDVNGRIVQIPELSSHKYFPFHDEY